MIHRKIYKGARVSFVSLMILVSLIAVTGCDSDTKENKGLENTSSTWSNYNVDESKTPIPTLTTPTEKAGVFDKSAYTADMKLMAICADGRISVGGSSMMGRCSRDGGVKVNCSIDPKPQECKDIMGNNIKSISKIGDTVRSSNGFEYTITKAYYVNKSDNNFEDIGSIKGRILILETKVKNNSNSTLDDIFPPMVFVHDDKNNKYGLIDLVGGFKNVNGCCSNFIPGLVKNVNFAFDVPTDSNIVKSEFGINKNDDPFEIKTIKQPAIIDIKGQIK